MVFLGCSMYFQLEPITTLASGRFTLMKPEIFNCGVFSVTMTSNNAESVHGVYNIRFFFCSFAPSPHFHVEGILEKRQILTSPALQSIFKLYSHPLLLFALTIPIFLRQLRAQEDHSFLKWKVKILDWIFQNL